jgi:hypothetical protein
VDSGSLPTTPSVYQDPKLTGKKDEFFSDAPIGKIYTEKLTTWFRSTVTCVTVSTQIIPFYKMMGVLSLQLTLTI